MSIKQTFRFLTLMLVSLVISWANCGIASAQKTVRYTFTGRNKSLILGIHQKDLGLYVSAGTAPKGVSVGTIEGVTYEETENENINDVGIGNTVGLPFIPQYLVMPEEEAIINFKNFAYEIKDIYWTSRSQVPLLTSKTSTWVTKWDGTTTSTNIIDWGDADADSKANSSSWQLFYHKKLFTKDSEYSGIRSLHVTCDTKKALRGHSMKDFIISYYEPELTITAPDELDLTGGTTTSGEFSATISSHKGAFNDAMITVTATTPDGTTVSLNSDNHSGTINSGSTVGSVMLTATLTFEGTVIATATKKVQIGQFDFDFVQRDLYCEYGTGTVGYGDASSLHAWWYLYKDHRWDDMDTNSGLRTFEQSNYGGTSYPEEKYWWASKENYLDYSNSELGKITNIYNPVTNDNNYYKACLHRIDYRQFVPAYSVVSIPITFDMAADRKSNKWDISSGYALAMYNFGQGSEQIWPDQEVNATKDTYKYFGLGNVKGDDYAFDPEHEPVIGSFRYHNPRGDSVHITKHVSTEFTFTNTYNKTGYVDTRMTQQLGAYSFVKNASALFHSWMDSYFDYSGRSKIITYYRYINYDGNGSDEGSSTETTTGTCLSTDDGYATATAAVAANSFTKADDASNTYQFIGWNTNADGTGTAYQTGDGVNIYDAGGKCGAGPMTLYAQWKTIPITSREVNADDNVYSLWGNGGTILDADGNEQEIVAAQFVLGATASNVNTATYYGYTFLGYYDDPEEGTQIFDATGAPVGDGTIITSNSKRWMAEHDVYLYAHWTRDESISLSSITITLDPNEGTLADASTITCTENSMENNNIATQTPTRDGYKFAGWYTTADLSGKMVYNASGESVTLQTYSIDSEGNITPVYTALNPTFFNTSGKYVGSEDPFNADFTIYAHWIADDATLTFHEGEGETVVANTAYYNTGSGNQGFSSNIQYEAAEYPTVSITRKLSKKNWNTVCFPFDIYKKQVATLFSDVEMFSSINVTGTSANMKFTKCDIMMAGIPYFVKLNSSLATGSYGTVSVDASDDNYVTQLTFSGVETSREPSTISFTSDNTIVSMVGEYNTDVNIPDNALFLQNNKLYKQGGKYKDSGKTYIYKVKNRGFRCYITNTTNSSNAKVFNLIGTSIDLDGILDGIEGDEATGIDDIDDDSAVFTPAEDIYDICGRKLSDINSKGVYIINGKKYIAQ